MLCEYMKSFGGENGCANQRVCILQAYYVPVQLVMDDTFLNGVHAVVCGRRKPLPG